VLPARKHLETGPSGLLCKKIACNWACIAAQHATGAPGRALPHSQRPQALTEICLLKETAPEFSLTSLAWDHAHSSGSITSR